MQRSFVKWSSFEDWRSKVKKAVTVSFILDILLGQLQLNEQVNLNLSEVWISDIFNSSKWSLQQQLVSGLAEANNHVGWRKQARLISKICGLLQFSVEYIFGAVTRRYIFKDATWRHPSESLLLSDNKEWHWSYLWFLKFRFVCLLISSEFRDYLLRLWLLV